MKIGPSISAICAVGFLIFMGHLLLPWFAETFGNAEENIDAKACASYKPLYINKVLFCQCSDTESQKPNKCSEKYKND